MPKKIRNLLAGIVLIKWFYLSACPQIFILMLSEFKRINLILFSQKT